MEYYIFSDSLKNNINCRYSKKFYTYEEALKAFKTLENCHSCENCYFCVECYFCENCKNCVDCDFCKNCENCLCCNWCELCVLLVSEENFKRNKHSCKFCKKS